MLKNYFLWQNDNLIMQEDGDIYAKTCFLA